MNMFWINLAIMAFSKILKDKEFVAQLQQFVVDAFNFDLEGEDKKKKVMESVKALGKTFGKALSFLVPMAISGLIEAFVSKEKLANPDLVKK